MFDDTKLTDLAQLLPEHVISELMIAVLEYLEGHGARSEAERVTRGAALEDARRIAYVALELAELLKQSPIVSSLGMVEAIRRGGGKVDDGWLPPGTGDDSGPQRLAAELMRLRHRAKAVVDATDGRDGPQLDPPKAGGKRHPAATIAMRYGITFRHLRLLLNGPGTKGSKEPRSASSPGYSARGSNKPHMQPLTAKMCPTCARLREPARDASRKSAAWSGRPLSESLQRLPLPTP